MRRLIELTLSLLTAIVALAVPGRRRRAYPSSSRAVYSNLWGGRDQPIPPAHAERFRRDIAGGRLVLFDHPGHVPHEEPPGETVAAVKEFLSHGRGQPAWQHLERRCEGPVAPTIWHPRRIRAMPGAPGKSKDQLREV